MGLKNCLQDPHWDVSIDNGIWEAMPLTSRAGAKSHVGHQKTKF